MKKTYDIIILGGNLCGLYAGIKFIDLGYSVLIIDKKNYNNIIYNNNDFTTELLNSNHYIYKNLLKKFNIDYKIIKNDNDISCDDIDKIEIENNLYYKIINIVIEKSKNIPQNILLSFTFTNLCKELLLNNEYEELINNIDNFYEIFNKITAYDALSLFTNDINNSLQYYKCDVSSLINKMINIFILKKGEILYNTEITDISYSDKFVLFNNINTKYISNILISTISKKNLISFKFWKKDQLKILNSVNPVSSNNLKYIFKFLYNYNNICKLIDNSSEYNDDNDIKTRNILLTELHIMFPKFKKKDKDIYFWNQNINNIIVREKIKKLYNSKFFICGESYCRNSIFINYSLETIDNIASKIIKIKL